MAKIEYPPLIWAEDITVRALDENGEVLTVQGTPLCMEVKDSSRDLLRGVQAAMTDGRQKRRGKVAPHIAFANASTDELLREFVARFGPVIASEVHTNDDLTVMTAHQRMDELRRERAIYAAVLELIHLQQAGEPDEPQIRIAVHTIATQISSWVHQSQRETRQRQTNGEQNSTWKFTDEDAEYVQRHSRIVATQKPHFLTGTPIHSAREVISTLLNAFPVKLVFWGDMPLDVININMEYGIRPALYFLLRYAVFQTGLIKSCGNRDCREFFEVERAGQNFCSEVCSRKQRQREYWAKAGREARKARAVRLRRSGKRSTTISGKSLRKRKQ